MATFQPKEQIVATIDTQGDTGAASRIKLAATRNNVAIAEQFAVRVRVCDENGFADATNATIAPDTGFGTPLTTHSATKDLDILSADTKANETLTISGVVLDGETVTLGARVYEFDHNGSVSGSNIAVDISAHTVAAEGTLTMDTQPTALDAFEIDGEAYTFVADGDDGGLREISIGADLAAAKVNFVAAINGTDGVNTAHPSVTAAAFSGDDCVLSAILDGVAGDSITTTENFTAVGNRFDAGTLGTTTAGADCPAANAVTELVAAITADASAVVTAADGVGNTVDVDAIVSGYAGDSIVSTETMSNGAFGGATLSGAVIPSEIYIDLTNGTAETVTLRFGPAAVQTLVTNNSQIALNVTHAAP